MTGRPVVLPPEGAREQCLPRPAKRGKSRARGGSAACARREGWDRRATGSGSGGKVHVGHISKKGEPAYLRRLLVLGSRAKDDESVNAADKCLEVAAIYFQYERAESDYYAVDFGDIIIMRPTLLSRKTARRCMQRSYCANDT